MNLPLASKQFLRVNETLFTELCQLTAFNPEAAAYLVASVEDLIGDAKDPHSTAVVAAFKEHANTVSLMHAPHDPWEGHIADNPFENYLNNLKHQIIKNFKPKSLHLDFAVTTDTQLMRSITLNEKPMDLPEELAAFDQIINATLFEKERLINLDGFIYEANDQGDLLVDKQGDFKKASPELVRRILVDSRYEFAKNFDNGVNVTVDDLSDSYRESFKLEEELNQPE